MKRTRKRFVPFYRYSVTYCGTSIVTYFLFFMLYFQDVQIMSTKTMFWNFFFIVLNLIIVEVHMRYIDSVHYAKTELSRDRFILKRYQLLQQQRKLLSSQD